MTWWNSPLSSTSKDRCNRGFTLIELMLAIFITALMISVLYGIFGSMSRTKQRLDADARVLHGARIFFDRLSKELRSLHFSSRMKQSRFVGGEKSGQLFLEFSSTLTTPHSGGAGAITLIRYETQKGSGEQKQLQKMTRQEQPLLESSAKEGKAYVMLQELNNFQMRFYRSSQDRWENDWDSRSGGAIPDLVEISLWFEIDGREIPFRSSFDLSSR